MAGCKSWGKARAARPNRIFAATNITLPIGSWTGIFTGKFAGGVFTMTDAQSTNLANRYYRVLKP